MLQHNFGNCELIYKISLPTDARGSLLSTVIKIPTSPKYVLTLPCER